MFDAERTGQQIENSNGNSDGGYAKQPKVPPIPHKFVTNDFRHGIDPSIVRTIPNAPEWVQIDKKPAPLAPSRQASYHPARASASRAKAIKRHEPSRDSQFACEGPVD